MYPKGNASATAARKGRFALSNDRFGSSRSRKNQGGDRWTKR